jgi:RNA polymerase sigma-70 factor (ECF subfamily)
MVDPPPLLRVVQTTSDAELVERCVAGDPSAQRQLFDRQYPRVHATLYRILGSNQAIDDVLQEVFLATWVDRCAVHAAFAHLRRGRRRQHLELVPESAVSNEVSAERRLLAREAARRLYAALDKLDPKQRLAFALHAIDGRPMQEVATLMDATLVATKARVWRARRYIEKRAKADPVLADFVSAGRRSDTEDADEEAP